VEAMVEADMGGFRAFDNGTIVITTTKSLRRRHQLQSFDAFNNKRLTTTGGADIDRITIKKHKQGQREKISVFNNIQKAKGQRCQNNHR
jgi:hypothetical protein